MGKKLKYVVFWAPQNSQSFGISEQKISVPVPVPYVSLHGPITLLEGHHNPLKQAQEALEMRSDFTKLQIHAFK